MRDLETYRGMLELEKPVVNNGHELTNQDRMRGNIIIRLMCHLSLDYKAMSAKCGVDFETPFSRRDCSVARAS